MTAPGNPASRRGCTGVPPSLQQPRDQGATPSTTAPSDRNHAIVVKTSLPIVVHRSTPSYVTRFVALPPAIGRPAAILIRQKPPYPVTRIPMQNSGIMPPTITMPANPIEMHNGSDHLFSKLQLPGGFSKPFAEFLNSDGSVAIELGGSRKRGEPTMSTPKLKSLLRFLGSGGLILCQQSVYRNPARLPSPAQWVNFVVDTPPLGKLTDGLILKIRWPTRGGTVSTWGQRT